MAELKYLNTEDGGRDDYDDTSSSSQSNTSSKKNERGQWANRVEFLLSIIGYTVGIGSIWRFPIMCMRNGGGAFLIPFFFFLIVYGAPLYYLEVYLGQFTGQSPPHAFEMCPLFKGVGWTMVVISFNATWYLMIILGWILYFLFHSFYPVLPWVSCDNWWNTPYCKELNYRNEVQAVLGNATVDGGNYTTLRATAASSDNIIREYNSPAAEFWMYNVLRKSNSLEEFGTVQWHLVVVLFAAWFLIMMCLIRGVRSLGKVVYVTATLPYVLLTVMFVRGLTLDGAIDGIMLYITPDFNRIATLQVWIEAAIQVFYSLGPAWGGVITMASYQKFNKRSFWEVTITVACDGFTAFYSGLVVFTILGFMAKESGLSVKEVAQAQGFGLVFVAYPEAISRLPLSQLWAVLFFITLVTVGLDSFFGMLETVISAVIDVLPRKALRYRTVITAMTIFAMFLLDLPFTTNGSMYLLQLMDWYCSAFGLFVAAGLEVIIICWIYGADRFSHDVEMMTGKHITFFMRLMWCYTVPGLIMVCFFLTVTNFKYPDYGDGYTYKNYAITIGYIVAFLPMVPVFVVMIKELITAKGTIVQRLRTSLQPSSKWAPVDGKYKEIYKCELYVYENTFLQRRKADLFGSTQNRGE